MTTPTAGLSTQTILLTGAAGKVARRLRAPLAKLCGELIVTDLAPVEGLAANERYVQCDLSSTSAVHGLVKGVHKIVHFAGYPREASWDTLIPANIAAVTNLWEAALEHGVRRIVYASTNHVVGFYPVTRQIDVNAEVKCDSRYGLTKAFTETLARFYYEKYGIESLGLRIGRVEDAPVDERMWSTWLHPDDLLQQVVLGLSGTVHADILYGVSANSRAWCSNPANSPYRPAHSADTYTLPAPAPGAPGTAWSFQGGPFAAQGYAGDESRAANFYTRDVPGA